MSLQKRVERLEKALRANKCPSCGWPPDEGEPLKIRFRWYDEDEPEETNEVCPECGRPLVIRIRLNWPNWADGQDTL